ncbi:MAG TPA: M1 family metallopeptidase [Candidatus Eisenbacteria bacterium]|nr:M1 family metallopeptidase [Candidatus Eisenbacteria bacterium]
MKPPTSPLRSQLLFLLAVGYAVSFPATSASAEDEVRLPTDVRPTFEAIHLNLDPDKPDYTGSVQIRVTVPRETSELRFHAQEMDLVRLELRGPGKPLSLSAGQDVLGIVTARSHDPIPPGDYELSIDFKNDFDRRASSLHRLQTGGLWYAFTQFEAIDARRAFPCWDEPGFKIPWQITLAIPQRLEGLSNTPVERETTSNGIRTMVFKETKPLPSYLLALAVGPLEFVPIPGLRVPGRVVVPRGSKELTKPAVAMAPALLAALERWFGIPYPYEKLDLIAVPEFSAGAMENPGAITYADRYLLFDEKTMSTEERRTLAVFTAHEMAHMWFGDYVTMKWWDDLWLNESFAEWMGNKIADEVYPEYMIRLRAVAEVDQALEIDSRLSTRAIRRPVTNMENLYEAADILAYKKGQSVLGMTERWIGPDAFRKGVIAYLQAHAYGTAEGSDLWNALGKASGKDVPGVLGSFLDQPGVPVVHASLRNDGQVELSQSRFLNYGVKAPGAAIWKIPITLTWESKGKPQSLTLVLDKERMTAKLPGHGKPSWIHPNADEAGYYRWTVDPVMLDRLTAVSATALTARERIGFIQNASALLEAGSIHGDQYLRILAGFSGETNPIVVRSVASGLLDAKEAFLTEENQEAFAGYVRRLLGPALRRYGLDRTPKESEAISLVRPTLYAWLGDEGKDMQVLAHADSLARSFLRDRGSIDPSLISISLQLAAIRGDASLYEQYRQRFETTTVPTDREPYLKAMGCFRSSELRTRALAYNLTGPLRPQEYFWIPQSIAAVPWYRDEVWAWWRDHFEEVTKKMPPEYGMYVTTMAGGCSESRLKSAEDFFDKPAHQPPGTEGMFAKVAEATRDCLGLRAREQEAAARVLEEPVGTR